MPLHMQPLQPPFRLKPPNPFKLPGAKLIWTSGWYGLKKTPAQKKQATRDKGINKAKRDLWHALGVDSARAYRRAVKRMRRNGLILPAQVGGDQNNVGNSGGLPI